METKGTSVNILGRKYKLRVAEGDEWALQKAAEAIEGQARSYEKMFAYTDHQDLLAMVALTQITQLTKVQSTMKKREEMVSERLSAIEKVIEEVLHPDQDSL